VVSKQNKSPQPVSVRSLLVDSRVVLLVGFGGLVALMAYAGINTIRAMSQTQERSARIQQEFVDRSRLLNQIRSDLYVSGTYVRDYLLEPEALNAERYRSDLDRVRKDMNTALEAYAQLPGSRESAPLSGLRSQLAQYWQALDPAMHWKTEERHQRGYSFLRDEVFPRRQAILRLADEISAFNEQQLNTGSEQVKTLFAEARSRRTIILLLTLLVGLALAGFTVIRILQLESHAMARFQEVVAARQELKDLSARLVSAQESERRTISRELHDEVGQSLSALLVGLSNLRATAKVADGAELGPHIDALQAITEESVRTIRNMALLLRPSMLDDLGLVPALRWQAREAGRHSGLRVDVAAEGVSDDLPDEHKTCVYRLVQEALHNVLRHAQAHIVRITVKQEPAALLLTVQDDGRGFDAAQERGLGLVGIEERVAQLGGSFRVESEIGRGTLLAVSLPLSQGAPA
jgi:signal transduction histidine kinase